MHYIYSHSRILWEFPRTETRGSLLKSKSHTEQRCTTCLSNMDLFSNHWVDSRPSNVDSQNDSAQSHKNSFCMAGPGAERQLGKPGYYTKTKPFHTRRFCLPASKMGFSYYVCSLAKSGSFSISLLFLHLFFHFALAGLLSQPSIHRLTHFTKSLQMNNKIY